MPIFVYLLRCADDSYYVGSTRASLQHRIDEHNSGKFGGFTATRTPVTLAWHQEFASALDAIAAERRLKGWGRAKKEALIAGDFTALRTHAQRRGGKPRAT